MSELKMLLFTMAVGPFFLHDRIHTLILLSILHYSTNTLILLQYIYSCIIYVSAVSMMSFLTSQVSQMVCLFLSEF